MSAMVSFFPPRGVGDPPVAESGDLLQPATTARPAAARRDSILFMPYWFAEEFAVGPAAWLAISARRNWTGRESATRRSTSPPLRAAGGREPSHCSTRQL